MRDTDVGFDFQHLAEQMIYRTVSCRAVVQLVGIGPRQRKKLLQGLCFRLRADDQQERRHRNGGNRFEVPDGIEGQLLVEAGIDRLRTFIGYEQGISVRGSFRDRIGADHARRARTVFDHDRLLPALAELLSDGACKGVRCSAGGLRHDDADYFGRVFFIRHEA